MQSIKIRLEGTPEKLDEAIGRMRRLFSIAKESAPYQSRHDASKYLCYLTVYTYGERGNLYEQVEEQKLEIQDLQEAIGRLSIENESLKEQLGQIPKPRPYDAVLGTPHRQKGVRHEG